MYSIFHDSPIQHRLKLQNFLQKLQDVPIFKLSFWTAAFGGQWLHESKIENRFGRQSGHLDRTLEHSAYPDGRTNNTEVILQKSVNFHVTDLV